MQTKAIRVGVVDDNDMIRYAMRVVLETVAGLECVGTGQNGKDAITLCQSVRPDVLLIDLIMPEMNGITAIRQIHRDMPDVRCLVLTSYDEAELVQDALRAGAVGYLIKNMSLDALADAIHDAWAGKATLAIEAVQALRDTPHTPGIARLNTRERQILGRMVGGHSDAAIAEALFIDPIAVEYHVGAILNKLRVANRVEAIAIALRDDLMAGTR
jgi:NarL family two-component system response regulator LiaR